MNRLSTIDYKNNVDNFLNKCKKDDLDVIIFDLETTGTNSIISKIISCSAIKAKYDGKSFKEIDRLNQFINPSFAIPKEITKITGIDDNMVKDSPTEYEAYEIIKDFFGLNPMLIGYNSTKFDEKFMTNLYLRAEGEDFLPLDHLDVFTMSKEMIGDLERHTLENVSIKLNLDKEITFHTSIDDVIATKRVCEKLIPEYFKESKSVKDGEYKIKGLRYRAKGHRIERIYVDTIPLSGTYYDNYKKEWLSEKDDLDLLIMKRKVLELKKVDSELDLVNKMKKEI